MRGINVDGWEEERPEERDRTAAVWAKVQHMLLWEDSFQSLLMTLVWVLVYAVLCATRWSALTMICSSLIALTLLCSVLGSFQLLAPPGRAPGVVQRPLIGSIALKVSRPALDNLALAASLALHRGWTAARPLILCDDPRRTLVFLAAVFAIGVLGTLVSTTTVVFWCGLVLLTVPKLLHTRYRAQTEAVARAILHSHSPSAHT